MAKVLVSGSTGMLGWMVGYYFNHDTGHDVWVSGRTNEFDAPHKKLMQFDVETFLTKPSSYRRLKHFDYVINCIGVIKPYCQDNDLAGVRRAMRINGLFPHALSRYINSSGVKIIQIATDCVYSGKHGGYDELSHHDPVDTYGSSKSLGEVFDENFINIRCSIIGPEMHTKNNLLEWFLSYPIENRVTGFSNHWWNGLTTLEFAKLCEALIDSSQLRSMVKLGPTHHVGQRRKMSKYAMLGVFGKVYNTKHQIHRKETAGGLVDRSLKTRYNHIEKLLPLQSLSEAVREMKDYSEGMRV